MDKIAVNAMLKAIRTRNKFMHLKVPYFTKLVADIDDMLLSVGVRSATIFEATHSCQKHSN